MLCGAGDALQQSRSQNAASGPNDHRFIGVPSTCRSTRLVFWAVAFQHNISVSGSNTRDRASWPGEGGTIALRVADSLERAALIAIRIVDDATFAIEHQWIALWRRTVSTKGNPA
jgi:hypothetical protein